MEKWTRLLVVVATCLLMVAFVAVAIRLGLYIHHTLLIFALAALIAYALDPIVGFLQRLTLLGRRMPRGLAIGIVFVALFALVGLGAYGLERPLAREVQLLSDPQMQQKYKDKTINFLSQVDSQLGHLGMHSNLAGYLQNPSSIPPNVISAASDVEKQVLPVVHDFVVSVVDGVFVLLIAIYLLVYGTELRVRLNSKLPPKLLKHVLVWEEDINRILGGFVRGQLIIALVMGIGAALACLAVGIHFWVLIGLFVVVVSLIPVFGPYLGAIPAIVLALIGPTHIHNNLIAAAVLLCLFVLINELGSKVLYPRLVGQAIGLHEVLVLFAILAGLELGGVVGVLFAAPLTAIVLVTAVHLYRLWQDLPDSLLSRSILPIREVSERSAPAHSPEATAKRIAKPAGPARKV